MIDGCWYLDVYCQQYRIELESFGEMSDEQREQTEDLLGTVLLAFDAPFQEQIRETLLEICETVDELFVYKGERAQEVMGEEVCEAVRSVLESEVRLGRLRIDRVVPWWETLSDSELDDIVRQHLPDRELPPSPRVVRVPPEPAPPVEKTWFSAQFVDESGLWIDGLSVKVKASGTAHDLTTDKAGEVELRNQTSSTAVVWVADIAQAEKILVDRLERLGEAPAPTGSDVVGYPVQEPAKNVVLSAETPKTVVLGLHRTLFEVRVVDEVGDPVPGLDLAFSAQGDSTLTTGAGGMSGEVEVDTALLNPGHYVVRAYDSRFILLGESPELVTITP